MSKKPAAPTSAPAATDELNPSLDAMLSTLSMARKGGDAAQAAAGETQRCGLIAIVGRPNVGKSTLLNALVGQKVSITSRKAQTTRHRITGIRTLGATQFIFVDTPGFQTKEIRGRTALNRNLNRTVTSVLGDVDVVLFMVEAGRFSLDDAKVLALLPSDKPTFLVPALLVAVFGALAVGNNAGLRTWYSDVNGARASGNEIAVLFKTTGDGLAPLVARLGHRGVPWKGDCLFFGPGVLHQEDIWGLGEGAAKAFAVCLRMPLTTYGLR